PEIGSNAEVEKSLDIIFSFLEITLGQVFNHEINHLKATVAKTELYI
ncbi:MAG: hypothetical protein H0V66_05220, partial [Bdellovibrionales bacterium]|nr:hypothetical protein [Bdellovibrionales bacterium]